jgi:hypothetical protein
MGLAGALDMEFRPIPYGVLPEGSDWGWFEKHYTLHLPKSTGYEIHLTDLLDILKDLSAMATDYAESWGYRYKI